QVTGAVHALFDASPALASAARR
ncbi:TetR family transcriptional regulator, partial [Streptomyces sp. McG6]|nr:TetR family transcriptional regulator [Streptomyces sp. McG6]